MARELFEKYLRIEGVNDELKFYELDKMEIIN